MKLDIIQQNANGPHFVGILTVKLGARGRMRLISSSAGWRMLG